MGGSGPSNARTREVGAICVSVVQLYLPIQVLPTPKASGLSKHSGILSLTVQLQSWNLIPAWCWVARSHAILGSCARLNYLHLSSRATWIFMDSTCRSSKEAEGTANSMSSADSMSFFNEKLSFSSPKNPGTEDRTLADLEGDGTSPQLTRSLLKKQ